MADAPGARRLVIVEDVDGVYTADPSDGPADLIRNDSHGAPRRRPGDAARRPNLPRRAKDQGINAVQVVNGLVQGNLTSALRDEHVGTIIRSS